MSYCNVTCPPYSVSDDTSTRSCFPEFFSSRTGQKGKSLRETGSARERERDRGERERERGGGGKREGGRESFFRQEREVETEILSRDLDLDFTY